MENKKSTVNYALLSWTRLKIKDSREYNKDRKKEILNEVKELEDYLLNCYIYDVDIIYISDDYYTVRYLIEEQQYVKQFTTEEVELSLK